MNELQNIDPHAFGDDDLLSHALILADLCQEEAKDVTEGMTSYQIERFVLGKVPPVGRYHQCCLEIRRRLEIMKTTRAALVTLLDKKDRSAGEDAALTEKREVMRGLQQEIASFKSLADRYKPLARGRRFDDPELQAEYWDQFFGWKLAIGFVSGKIPPDLIQSITCLHESSSTRQFMQRMFRTLASGENGPERSQIEKSLSTFIEEYRCVENVQRPRLPAG